RGDAHWGGGAAENGVDVIETKILLVEGAARSGSSKGKDRFAFGNVAARTDAGKTVNLFRGSPREGGNQILVGHLDGAFGNVNLGEPHQIAGNSGPGNAPRGGM